MIFTKPNLPTKLIYYIVDDISSDFNSIEKLKIYQCLLIDEEK